MYLLIYLILIKIINIKGKKNIDNFPNNITSCIKNSVKDYKMMVSQNKI